MTRRATIRRRGTRLVAATLVALLLGAGPVQADDDGDDGGGGAGGAAGGAAGGGPGGGAGGGSSGDGAGRSAADRGGLGPNPGTIPMPQSWQRALDRFFGAAPTAPPAPAAPPRRAEIVALGVPPAALARLRAEGFAVVAERQAPALLRLRGPAGMPEAQALARLRAAAPGVAADRNHRYRLAGEPPSGPASGPGAGANAVAPVPGGGGGAEQVAPPAAAAPARSGTAAVTTAAPGTPAPEAAAPGAAAPGAAAPTPVPGESPATARPAGGAAGCAAADGLIALVDTGVDPRHPALAGRLERQEVLRGPGRRPARTAHGTAVAARLAAAVPGPRIAVLDAFHLGPDGEAADAFDLAAAIARAGAIGAGIATVSVVGPANAVVDRLGREAAAAGTLFVAAAGNDGPRAAPLYPAAYGWTVAVAAVDAAGRPWARSAAGPHIAFAALGVEVPLAPGAAAPARRWSGTSFAAPVVSAALALVPEAGAARIEALAALARDAGVPGRDAVYGWGVVEARPCPPLLLSDSDTGGDR